MPKLIIRPNYGIGPILTLVLVVMVLVPFYGCEKQTIEKRVYTTCDTMKTAYSGLRDIAIEANEKGLIPPDTRLKIQRANDAFVKSMKAVKSMALIYKTKEADGEVTGEDLARVVTAMTEAAGAYRQLYDIVEGFDIAKGMKTPDDLVEEIGDIQNE